MQGWLSAFSLAFCRLMGVFGDMTPLALVKGGEKYFTFSLNYDKSFSLFKYIALKQIGDRSGWIDVVRDAVLPWMEGWHGC